MIIAGKYSFNNGEKVIQNRHPQLLNEIEHVINSVNKDEHKTKKSREKTMDGRLLYSPASLNKAFKEQFFRYNWESIKIQCDYPIEYYTPEYNKVTKNINGAYREMDFLKDKLGVEVQFGKYSFMVYNVCAKMTIFKNHNIIDTGVEIVPVKELATQMSTGVSYFEQFVWDLINRGVSDIDIPVLIIGIA